MTETNRTSSESSTIRDEARYARQISSVRRRETRPLSETGWHVERNDQRGEGTLCRLSSKTHRERIVALTRDLSGKQVGQSQSRIDENATLSF